MTTDTREALAALLPCPFCGNAKGIAVGNEAPTDNSGGYFIACPACHASTGLRFACGEDPVPLLIEQWNRRAALATQPAQAVPPLSDAEVKHIIRTTPMGGSNRERNANLVRAAFDVGVTAAAAPAQPSAQGEAVHPESLRGLVEGAGGHYLTGGGAAFTSIALAKFVVDVVLASAPAAPAVVGAETPDDDERCPTCGEDGGTSCGMPNCGLLA